MKVSKSFFLPFGDELVKGFFFFLYAHNFVEFVGFVAVVVFFRKIIVDVHIIGFLEYVPSSGKFPKNENTYCRKKRICKEYVERFFKAEKRS